MWAARFLFGLLFAVGLAACGGGGGGGGTSSGAPPAPVPTPSPAPTTTGSPATASLQVVLDGGASASARRRRPQYISPSTASATIAINSRPAVPIALGIGAPGCTTAAAGNLTCTITLSAPVGADTLTVVTYSGPNATGQVLSSNTAGVTVSASGSNTVALTLAGVPSTISFGVAPAQSDVLGNQNTGFTLIGTSPQLFLIAALDASGNIIVGPGAPTIAVSPVSSALTAAAVAGAPNEYTLTATSFPASPVSVGVTATAPGANGSASARISFTLLSSLASPSPSPSPAPSATALPFALYVLADENLNNATRAIDVFPAGTLGNATPSPAPIAGSNAGIASDAGGLAVAHNGTTYAGSSASGIAIFTPGASGNTAPTASLAGPNGHSVQALALDAAGNLYALTSNAGTSSAIGKYAGAAGTPTLIQGTNTGFYDFQNTTARGLGVDAQGFVYVGIGSNGSNGELDSINVFAPGAFGTVNPAPVRTIAGPDTGMTAASTFPEALAVAADGTVYVVNASTSASGGATILVFGPGAAGDASPIRTITSSYLTQFSPIALDQNGNIYIASAAFAGPTIAVYAPNASGLPRPLFTISGAATQFLDPLALALPR